MKKRQYPKTVLRKKLIKGTFWTGFTLVLFLSIVAIVRVGNAGAGVAEQQPVEQTTKEVNLATSEGAQSFAQNFADQYFHWQNTDEGKKDRVERLKPYLANGLHEQAGLAFEGMQWNSSLSKSQVWKVEETGKNTANITLRIQHLLKRTVQTDPKATEEAAKAETPAKEQQAGPYEKYFVVPIKTDGQAFVVHQIPYFAAAPTKPEIAANTRMDEANQINDSAIKEQVQSFLHTFFKVYTTGTQDELSYYIQGDSIHSMTGIMTFQQVKDILITPGTSSTEYRVIATAVFQENQSKAQMIYPYELVLLKEEGRWFVKDMKNQ